MVRRPNQVRLQQPHARSGTGNAAARGRRTLCHRAIGAQSEGVKMRTSSPSRHVETIKQIYEWFGRGDAEHILAEFAPDVEFRLAEGHPYQPSGAPWIGQEQVVQNFFMKAG